MAFTKIYRVEISSFGNPITEKQLSDAIETIVGVKSIDIEEE